MKKILKAIAAMSTILATILAIIATFIIQKQPYIQYISIIIIIFQALSIVFSFFYQKEIDKIIFKGNKKILFLQVDSNKFKTSIQGARQELRDGLIILMTIAVIVCILWVFTTKNLLLFISCICMLSVGFIYADYIPHTKSYARKYDKNHLSEGEKESANRRLARIYHEEFIKTNFKRKNKLYQEWANLKYDESSQQQDECIKFILRSGLDAIKTPNIITNILVLVISVFTIIPGVTDFLASNILKNISLDYNTSFLSMLVVINITLLCLNFQSISCYDSKSQITYNLINLIIGDNKKARFDEYKAKYEMERTIRARGIFDFCSTYMDKGSPIEKIDFKYRMLFTHRFDANLPRFHLTVILMSIALLCVLMDLSLNWSIIGVIYVFIFVFTILFRYFILEKIGKYRIMKECKNLK